MICYQTSEILLRESSVIVLFIFLFAIKKYLGTFSNMASLYHCRSYKIFQYLYGNLLERDFILINIIF